MLITVKHPNLSTGQTSFLSEASQAEDESLVVQDSSGFKANTFVVIGMPGAKRTEIGMLANDPTDSFNLDMDTPILFNHPSNTTIREIRYDKIKVYSSDEEDGVYAEISGSPFLIDIDEFTTIISDISGDRDTWYKTAYFNSYTEVESAMSSPMQGSGPKEGSLRSIIDQVRTDMSIKNDFVSVTDDEITSWVNQAINAIQKKRNWEQTESIIEMETVANQESYSLPSGVNKVRKIKLIIGSANYYPRYITPEDFFMIETTTPPTYGDAPSYYTTWANELLLRPVPISNDLDLVIYAYSDLQPLKEDNDVVALKNPEILVYWANMMVMAKRKDKEWVVFWKNMFDAQLGDMIRSFAGGAKNMDNFKQVSRTSGRDRDDRFRIVATNISQE